MAFPLGYIPDDYAPDKWTPMAKLVGAAPEAAPSESPGLVMWADRVESQPGSSCVGHGIAGALYARQGAENTARGEPNRPRVFPSPLAIYYNARLKGGYANRDIGSQPYLAFEGLSDYGYCAIENWPSNETNIFEQPPVEAYRLAADQRLVQYYRIVQEGEPAGEDVKLALSKQYPVVLALQLDAAFQDLTGGIWKGPKGKIIGGHYVWAVEYNWEYVVICNSWGRNWGLNGFGRVAWSAIRDPNITSDRYGVTFAPAPVREAA